MLGIVDPFDDVSLPPDTGVRKNRVSGGQIFEIRFERTDVNGRTARSVVGQIQGGRDFLDGVESRELADANAHGVARMDQTVGARLDPAVSAIRICGRPSSGAVDFAWLNRAVA